MYMHVFDLNAFQLLLYNVESIPAEATLLNRKTKAPLRTLPTVGIIVNNLLQLQMYF
jgi:hypothetical protein